MQIQTVDAQELPDGKHVSAPCFFWLVSLIAAPEFEFTSSLPVCRWGLTKGNSSPLSETQNYRLRSFIIGSDGG